MSNLIRAISENGGVIFCAVDSTEVVCAMERIHGTSAVTSAALGRLLTAAGMMGVMLKGEDNTVTLRIKGDGPMGTLIAVANGKGEVKGYVENPIVELPPREDGKLNVGAAVGLNGTLSVIKDLGMKKPYVGQIPLVSGEIAEDITAYYATSEQTPTVCALGVLVDKDLSILKAGGYMVQLLPGATEDEISMLEKNISKMSSVTQLLLEGRSLTDMMSLALDGFTPNVLDEQCVTYTCDCSLARVQRALISLGREELEKLAQEQNKVEVECHFCDKKYEVNATDLIQELFAES